MTYVNTYRRLQPKSVNRTFRLLVSQDNKLTQLAAVQCITKGEVVRRLIDEAHSRTIGDPLKTREGKDR